MTKAIDFELAGMKLKVVVGYTDKWVEYVDLVFAVGKDGREMLMDCDTGLFYESFERELQDAFDEYVRDERIAYAEMRMDAAREEGRL